MTVWHDAINALQKKAFLVFKDTSLSFRQHISSLVNLCIFLSIRMLLFEAHLKRHTILLLKLF